MRMLICLKALGGSSDPGSIDENLSPKPILVT